VENYLINNKTVALQKDNNKTIIYNVDKVIVINKNINNIIDYNCNYYGSTLIGRKKSAQQILNVKYKLPIIIDDINNITIIQLNSPRNKKCLYLVTNKVIDYNENENFLNIRCANNINFNVKISLMSFEKMLIKSIKLYNVLIWRKNANFL